MYVKTARFPESSSLQSTKIQRWSLLGWWRREEDLGSKELPGKGPRERNVLRGRGGSRVEKESDDYVAVGWRGPGGGQGAGRE